MKSQPIRLLDIFFLGPIMIYFGISRGKKTKLERAFFVVSGVATIFYNLKNYQEIETEKRQQAAITGVRG